MAVPLSPPPLSLSGRTLEVFADSYSGAREMVLAAAQHLPCLDEMATFVNDSASRGEASQFTTEQLSTETVWLGCRTARNVLVLISATHGVEGFVGAAVQADPLQRIRQGYLLPPDTAILILFALNPSGFALCRRCDEQGIDLNRNFIDFSQPLPANNDYDRVAAAIYAETSTERDRLFDALRKEWGQTRFEVAVSGGQYSDPQGPFFGGKSPAHGHQVIEQLIARYQLASRHLAVIDIHSGLGPYAHGEIINDHPLESHGYQVANRWYGASVTAPAAGSSSSVCKTGLLDYCWHRLMQQRGCFVTLEFGSYGTTALFDVILGDHRSWKAGNPESTGKSALAMKEHFCPQDNYWRELVLVKSRQAIQQALDGLQYE